MNEQDTLNKLTGIFRQLFDDKNLSISTKTSASDIDGWDSFMHINLIVAIEAAFGVKFKTAETEELKNVGDLTRLIEKKTART